MANNKEDTAFDVGMFVMLALGVMGYFAAIGPAYGALSALLPIPAVMAPLAPVMIVFLLITMVGAVGTPVFKAANKLRKKRMQETIEQGEEEYTYADAENQLREVFNTTLDKTEQTASIISAELSDDGEELDVTFSVRSGREYVDTFSISGNENWDESNPVAVLFEYLEKAPPTDYSDLALADKDVYIRTQAYSENDFTLDIKKMRENLPEGAFEFNQVNALVDIEDEEESEEESEVEAEHETNMVEKEVMTE